jgi:hypothetical protein
MATLSATPRPALPARLPISRNPLSDFAAADARALRTPRARLAIIAAVALVALAGGYAVAAADVNGLFLCAALIGCVFLLLDFRIGVVLLICLMPVSRSSVFPHEMLGINGLNPLNLLLAATVGSYLLAGLFDGSLKRFIPRPLLWLYMVPVLIAGLVGSRHAGEIASYFYITGILDWYDSSGYLREILIKPMFFVLFGVMVAAAVAKSKNIEGFLTPALISIWIMVAVAIWFVLSAGISLAQMAMSSEREFFTPLGMHANSLGRLYAVAYALLLFTWADSDRSGLKIVLLASMGLVVVALMLTFSRGAFLAFAFVNLFFLFSRFNAKTFVFCLVLGAAGIFLMPGEVYERVTMGFGSGLNTISAGRWENIWLPMLAEVWRSPFFGSGLSSILWSQTMVQGVGQNVIGVTHAHNAYLQTVLDMGFVGLTLLCLYFAHVWKGFRTLSRDASLTPTMRGFYRGAAAGLVSFLIAGTVGSALTPIAEQSFLWLAIGMMYGHLAHKRQTK